MSSFVRILDNLIGFMTLGAALAAAIIAHGQEPDSLFSQRYRVICPNSPLGCPCLKQPDNRVFHGQVTLGLSDRDEIKEGKPTVEVRLQPQNKTCVLENHRLVGIYWQSNSCPDTNKMDDLPFAPLQDILETGRSDGNRSALGLLFPTYYNIAQEAFFPGPKTETLLNDKGQTIAKVSPSYRRDLDIEGTGQISDGRVLNVSTRIDGIWRYLVLPRGSFGLGIHGHYLYPYRAAAVDFDYLCRKANLSSCSDDSRINRRRLVGSLIYIPRLKGIDMGRGRAHDGFVCAQDIGGAIKQDRIDLFVGPLGGGNPYLPPCQSQNPSLSAGIQSLNPTDWRTWRPIPGSEPPRFERVNPIEYRTVSPSKGLEAYLVAGARCHARW